MATFGNSVATVVLVGAIAVGVNYQTVSRWALTATTLVGMYAAGFLLANRKHAKQPSGFGSGHTAEEISKGLDLKGKVAMVTGANSGIGLQTAAALALRGAHVFVLARSMAKAKTAIQTIQNKHKIKGKLTPMVLDLADLLSVKTVVEQFKRLALPLHIVVCNAGVMALPDRTETQDGFEAQIGTNHLGHFALVTGLLPALKLGSPSRVVCVSSSGHRLVDPEFLKSDSLESKEYNAWTAYGNAKFANVLMADELNRRYKAEGVTAYSLHPGGIWTGLQTHVSWGTYVFWTIVSPFFFKSVEQGASTSVYCATAPGLEEYHDGAFFEDNNPSKLHKKVQEFRTEENSRKLWETSDKLISQ